MKKTNDAGTGLSLHSPVFFVSDTGLNSGCRNADAGVNLLDADAQLWYSMIMVKYVKQKKCGAYDVTTRHIARCTAVCEMLFWNSAI
jgi:hypothetical protein